MAFYTANTPQSTDPINVTQPLIEANFQQLDTYTSVDHVPLNAANQGQHKQVTMSTQVLPTTNSGQGALYTKTGGSGTELWFVRDNVPSTAVALTSSGVTAPSRTTIGYTYLPGNILLQWGFAAMANPGASITFPITFAVVAGFSPIVTVTSQSVLDTNSYLSVTATAAGSFTFNTNIIGGHGYWMAVGPI